MGVAHTFAMSKKDSEGVNEAAAVYAKAPLPKLNSSDSKGRVALGTANANKLWQVEEQPDGSILLTPMVAVPEREVWFYKNPEAQAMVQKGLEQSRAGETVYLGYFADELDSDSHLGSKESPP